MDLTTRCPKCGTVFQAGLSDLQLRKGYIRCVQCAHIFDGYAEVVSDASAAPAAAPPPPPANVPEPPAAPAPQVIRPGRSPAPPSEFTPAFRIGVAPWPDDRPEPRTGEPAAPARQVFRPGRSQAPPSGCMPSVRVGVAPWPDDRPEPRVGEPAVRAGTRPVEEILADEGWVPDAGGAPDDAGMDDPPAQEAPFVVEPRPGHRSQGGSAAPLLRDKDAYGWWDALLRFCARLLFVLLLILLAAQAVYVYRADIARMVPALRPALERACEPLRCQVPYARDIARIAITGSSLKAADDGAMADRPADQ